MGEFIAQDFAVFKEMLRQQPSRGVVVSTDISMAAGLLTGHLRSRLGLGGSGLTTYGSRFTAEIPEGRIVYVEQYGQWRERITPNKERATRSLQTLLSMTARADELETALPNTSIQCMDVDVPLTREKIIALRELAQANKIHPFTINTDA